MVLIYTDKYSNRLEYTARLIFNDILRSEVRFTDNVILFKQSDLPKINYSGTRLGNELFISAGSFLFEKSIEIPDVQPVDYEGETGFFATSADSFLPFDPFASAFLIVSRMEEYIPGPRDSHGRFIPENTILYRNNLLEKPVVNRWAWLVAGKLRERYRQLVFINTPFRFLSTIDVDNAFAYISKGLFRTAGALLKSLFKGNISGFNERLNVLLGRVRDPYDTYQYLFDQFKGQEVNVRFFFLLGDVDKYDRQVSRKNSHFRKLITDVSNKFITGIHPSYSSSQKDDPGILEKEKDNLEKIISGPVSISRQHYLLLNFPITYQNLIKSGIKEDYSMGFAGLPGFRAGICTPYNFYDLVKDEETSLQISPFQVMDVTLNQYLNLSPQQAIHKTEVLMDEVKAVGGLFCSIWHNENLGDQGTWKGYREVFETLNQLGFYYAGGKE